jgi:hypothetical protein
MDRIAGREPPRPDVLYLLPIEMDQLGRLFKGMKN